MFLVQVISGITIVRSLIIVYEIIYEQHVLFVRTGIPLDTHISSVDTKMALFRDDITWKYSLMKKKRDKINKTMKIIHSFPKQTIFLNQILVSSKKRKKKNNKKTMNLDVNI